MKVYLDVDSGWDTNEQCVLVMLLRWSGAEISGFVTVTESGTSPLWAG